MTGALDPVRLRAAVVTPGNRWLGVEHHTTIGSTNARAAQVAQPWWVVTADHQSQGRGRLARRWEAPPGASVAVSATVPLPRTGMGWTPLLAGLAVVDAVEATTGLSAQLKWPNDVLLPADRSRKVCGILCEVLPSPQNDPTTQLVVVGAGLNIGQERGQLPVPTGTSLALAGAGDVDRTALVAAYLHRLAELLDEAGADTRAGYRRRCLTIGQDVALSLPDGETLEGRAVAVDDEGRLVVDGPRGRRAWAAGDVIHARMPAAGSGPTSGATDLA